MALDYRNQVPEAGSITSGEVTRLLSRYCAGEKDALNAVIGLVYEELKKLAVLRLLSEDQLTLTPTGLVHEVYLRLSKGNGVYFRNRGEFFFFAGHLMRQVLVDLARRRVAVKRGAKLHQVPMPAVLGGASEGRIDLETVLALDEALQRLAKLDPRQAEMVVLRFFAGLRVVEIAELLGISKTSVTREWRTAKRWLSRELMRTKVGSA